MTKEELEKEAIEYIAEHSEYSEIFRQTFVAVDTMTAMVDFAEPREKRIAELQHKVDTLQGFLDRDVEYDNLQKENAELKENLRTAYRKGMRHIAKALKDYDRTDGAWTDYFEHTVDSVLQREQLEFEEYGTLADQLTKAKELIKTLLLIADNKVSQMEFQLCVADAKQFLKEAENE